MISNASDWPRHRLLVVIDGDSATVDHVQRLKVAIPEHFDWIESGPGPVGVGGAKNLGAKWQSRPARPVDGQLLMFSDNDMYYLPKWDTRLELGILRSNATQLGGWKHPFHGPIAWLNGPLLAHTVDAVTGNCFVIRWGDWLRFGPFDSNAIGPGQSEDYALSQKIKAGGGVVATLDPPIAIHCGIMNSDGKPATGWQEMLGMALGQMREHHLLDVVQLEVPKAVVERVIRPAPEPISQYAPSREIATQAPQLDPRTICPITPRSAEETVFFGVNCGSGQRPFKTARTPEGVWRWQNVDRVSRPPDQIPDLICDVGREYLPYRDGSVDTVVFHHVLEHFGCGEADEALRDAWRVLRPGGSLLVFVPDMRRLAGRWLNGEIDDYTFMVNAYGAYQGEEGDRHRWGFSGGSLFTYLHSVLPEGAQPKVYNWRDIPGADIARDWWIAAAEYNKP